MGAEVHAACGIGKLNNSSVHGKLTTLGNKKDANRISRPEHTVLIPLPGIDNT